MKTIQQIKKELSEQPMENLMLAIQEYQDDTREGVKKLRLQFEKNVSAYEKELQRIEALSVYEKKYREKGYQFIGGIDEAGRGPLAGPVVAAAVILPVDCDILYLDDSKKLSEKKRNQLFAEINEKAVAVSVGIVDHDEIDRINILQATYVAMQEAVKGLPIKPDCLLVDAVTIPKINIIQEPIIKGDAKSISIAAASIIAKVTRDEIMLQYDQEYPGYGFAEHKGYGTQKHIHEILNYGLCKIHRRTFVKGII